MLWVFVGIGLLICWVFIDLVWGAGLLLKLFSKTPDGPEPPRYRGR